MANVSVVIPAHNRADLLRRAITSVLRQTYPDFEVLVADDGSTDATEAIVAGFQDARVRLLRLGMRGGPARARNHGIQVARSEIVAFLDSDDEWLPTKLEWQLGRLARSTYPARTLVYCRSARRDTLTGRTIAQRHGARRTLLRQLARGWSFMTSAAAGETLGTAGGRGLRRDAARRRGSRLVAPTGRRRRPLRRGEGSTRHRAPSRGSAALGDSCPCSACT